MGNVEKSLSNFISERGLKKHTTRCKSLLAANRFSKLRRFCFDVVSLYIRGFLFPGENKYIAGQMLK